MKKQLLLICSLATSIFAFAEGEYSTLVNNKAALLFYPENSETTAIKVYCVNVVNETQIIIPDTYNKTNIGVEPNHETEEPYFNMGEIDEYKVVLLGNGSRAFAVNPAIITAVTIGQYVESISAKAFVGFTALETFTCNATTPPTIAEGAMDKMPESANLVVPIGTEETYWASDWGKYFTLINGEEKPSEGDATGISTTKAQKQIWLVGRIIKLAEEQEVRVYNIAGATIFSGYAAEVELPSSGIFVVKTATETAKFNCR